MKGRQSLFISRSRFKIHCDVVFHRESQRITAVAKSRSLCVNIQDTEIPQDSRQYQSRKAMSDPDTHDHDTRSSGEIEDNDQELEDREEGELGGAMDQDNSSQDLSNSISPSSSRHRANSHRSSPRKAECGGSDTKKMDKLKAKDKDAVRELLEKERQKQKKWEHIEREEDKKKEEEHRRRREEREREDEKRSEERRRRREKEKEKDKERRQRREELKAVYERQKQEAWERRKKELEAQKIVEEEEKKKREAEEVERRVSERVEKHITALVEEQLEIHKKSIETDLMKKVKLARLKMEKELKEEIFAMRKECQEHHRKRKEDYEKYVADTEKKIEEEKKKIAEEWLETLAEKERIDKELRKQKKKEEKKIKDEQSKILGKDKSRPKLSFSLNKAS